MIRINLLGRARPKPARRAVPLEATLQLVFLLIALLAAVGFLWLDWYQGSVRLRNRQAEISRKQSERAQLQQLKEQIDKFKSQKEFLQQRIAVIEELQRNRTGGQELLDMVATTVTRTDGLWLTSLTRKGDALTFDGSAASINAVANFITQLKRSGYFQKVEIKESKQDERSTAVQTFTFTLMAELALPQSKPPAAPAPPKKG
jgi:type IV pilus assembly protein PilN